MLMVISPISPQISLGCDASCNNLFLELNSAFHLKRCIEVGERALKKDQRENSRLRQATEK